MKKLRIAWFDDKPDRVEAFRDVIQAGIGAQRAEMEVIGVGDDILERMKAWAEENRKSPPDILAIDHVFNAGLPFGLKGSSVAHLLRSEFPHVPMVCVTSMFDHPQSFDQEDISEYTALFMYNRLEDNIPYVFAIARDFKKLHAATSEVREHLVACLKAPKRDREDLMRVLPEEFMREKHVTTEHRMARWVFNVLLKRAGFLYDRLHAAALLGLSLAGFAKVEDQFSGAKYKGVFATDNDPKWWVSALRKRLFDLGGDTTPDLPQHAGRQLAGVTKEDFSVCYVSKKTEPPPDAVVSTDTTAVAKRQVVQRQFSDRHPLDLGITPGFETRLVLKRRSR